MFDLYGCYFKYAGVSSEQYGLVFGNVDTSRFKKLAGDRTVNSIYTRSNYRNYLTKISYEDGIISFDAEVVTTDGSDICEDLSNTIERWLFNQNIYQELRYYYLDLGEPTLSTTFMKCLFVNPERIESGSGCVGYKFTVYTDSIMLWEDATTITHEFDGTGQSQSSQSIQTVTVNSDLSEYIYPIVKITAGSETLSSGTSRDITIVNQTDSSTRLTKLVNLDASDVITMNGELKYLPTADYTHFSERNFIRLKNGTNNIQIIGNIKKIEFEFNNRKYF